MQRENNNVTCSLTLQLKAVQGNLPLNLAVCTAAFGAAFPLMLNVVVLRCWWLTEASAEMHVDR